MSKPNTSHLILLVDDHPDILKLSQVLLEDKGYACTSAESITKAKSLIIEKDIDLMITDYEIGDDLADELIFFWQKHKKTKPVILSTGFYGIKKSMYSQIPIVQKPNWDRVLELVEELLKN